MILDVLRTATEPMNTTNVSKMIVFDKGISDEEGFDFERFCKVILASLSRCESNGLIECVGKDGLSILWWIRA